MPEVYRAEPLNGRPLGAGVWLLCLMPMLGASGQSEDDSQGGGEQRRQSIHPADRDVPVDAREEIDEITVVGPRSLVAIERQIERADLAMYDIANALIDDPLYKTYCRLETSAGTNVKRRICVPGYERELMSEAWEDDKSMRRMGEGGVSFDYKLPEGELRKYRENYKQIMIRLATDNPKLAEAIYERAQLQQEFDSTQRARHQKEE